MHHTNTGPTPSLPMSKETASRETSVIACCNLAPYNAVNDSVISNKHREQGSATHLVIVTELLTGRNVPASKYAKVRLPIHHASVRLAVWAAAVVDEPSEAAGARGINDGRSQPKLVIVPPSLPVSSLLNICDTWAHYLHPHV